MHYCGKPVHENRFLLPPFFFPKTDQRHSSHLLRKGKETFKKMPANWL